MDTPPSFKSKPGLGRIWRAGIYSRDGFAAAFRHEAAFRQELAIGLPMIASAWWLAVTPWHAIVATAAVLLVFIVELLNSAIEALADAITAEPHALIKQAKDIGSAAVLLSLLLAGGVWSAVVWQALAR
jgi:diacylglycerol kinase (ATP)